MKLLIDADFIVYKCCAAAEDEIDWGDDVIVVVSSFSRALNSVERELSKIKEQFMWDIPELNLFFLFYLIVTYYFFYIIFVF